MFGYTWDMWFNQNINYELADVSYSSKEYYILWPLIKQDTEGIFMKNAILNLNSK